MWPLSGAEVIAACGGQSEKEPAALAALEICGATGGSASAGMLFVALRAEGWDSHAAVADQLDAGAALALVAGDWAERHRLPEHHRRRCVVVPDTLSAFWRLAAQLRRQLSFPVVAIGGSAGKTTTKDMLAAMLSGGGRRVTKTPATQNGFIGIPTALCSPLHHRGCPPSAAVIEIGIDAPGAMAQHAALVAPEVAVLTALGAEHLAGLGSPEHAALQELLLFATPGCVRVYQADDEQLAEQARQARPGDVVVGGAEALGRLRPRLPEPGIRFVELRISALCATATALRLTVDGRRSVAAEVPLAGAHNAQNFALAFGAGLALGRDPLELWQGFQERFEPPPRRCEISEQASVHRLIDDSYNANPLSVRAALELLAEPLWPGRARVVILGDMLELGAEAPQHHAKLAPLLGRLRDCYLCLYGDLMAHLYAALSQAEGYRPPLLAQLPSCEDPGRLLDLIGPEILREAVVLVKGSRAMRLERVVHRLQQPAPAAASPRQRGIAIGVVGSRWRTPAARLLAALLEPLAPAATVHDLDLGSLEQGALAGISRWQVGLFTDFEPSAASAHEPEQQLAQLAQLFMRLPPAGVAVLNGADDCADLLAEIVPAGVRLLRYGLTEVAGDSWDVTACATGQPAAELLVVIRPSCASKAQQRLTLRPAGPPPAAVSALAAALASGIAPASTAARLAAPDRRVSQP